MPFQIIRNDITKVNADVIVNTANPEPVIGSGTDMAVYQAAGKRKLLKERQKIGRIKPGETAYTRAFRLNAKYIFHTVGPVWIDGNHGEREILHSCYEKSLALADELSCESIAFPLMATGSYGFPKDEALQIALAEINKFLLSHDMEVILVVFDTAAFRLSEKLSGEIRAFIDDHEVQELRQQEYCSYNAAPPLSQKRGRRKEEELRYQTFVEEALLTEDYDKTPETERIPAIEADYSASPVGMAAMQASAPCSSPKSLDEVLQETGDTFQERLFRLIDERGLKDAEVYKKANIDRKVFSKIRCNPEYHPKKKTAIAFAIALELDMDAMEDLLSRAELAFSPSNKFDLIITYFVTHKNYDIFEINATLFQYGQPLLGE